MTNVWYTLHTTLLQKQIITEETIEDVPYSLQTSPTKNVSQEWTSAAQPAYKILITIIIIIQAVVLKHNKPCPRVAHRGTVRFLRIDPKLNQVIPWSLRTFPENFMQIGPAIVS